jgi:hypothetical protein
LTKLDEGLIWLLDTLYQTARENKRAIDDLFFIPMSHRIALLLVLKGEVVVFEFRKKELEDCAEGQTFNEQTFANRVKFRHCIRELLKPVRSKNLCGGPIVIF